MWFLANDPRLPAAIRTATASWGLAADEFTATGGWPPQLYVREARRMLSAYVMTERNCRGTGDGRRSGRPGHLHHGLAQLPAGCGRRRGEERG